MVQGTSCAKIASLWPMTTARATMGMTTQSAQARFPRRCVVIHRPRHFSISTHCGIIGNTSATKSGNKLFNAHSIIIAGGSSFTMAEATRSFITHRMVDTTNESRLFSSESDGEAKLLEEVQDANERCGSQFHTLPLLNFTQWSCDSELYLNLDNTSFMRVKTEKLWGKYQYWFPGGLQNLLDISFHAWTKLEKCVGRNSGDLSSFELALIQNFLG